MASISILIAAISFWVTYQSSKETPKPPYDVKVIENSTLSKELESLKEELNKTKLLLETILSDTISK